jgi:hypothetical protein
LVVGQFGSWTPIGAEQTSTGYEVALHNTASGLYTVWNTDPSGNVTYAAVAAVAGTSTALESLEPSFHQDLNGDGVIGVPSGQTITAGLANHTLTGGPGADTFVFAPINPTTTNGVYAAGFGQDVITNFMADPNNGNHDVLQFSSSMFAAGTTASALAGGTAHNAAGGQISLLQQGSNVVITIDPTDTITLNNVSLSVLTAGAASDFHLV